MFCPFPCVSHTSEIHVLQCLHTKFFRLASTHHELLVQDGNDLQQPCPAGTPQAEKHMHNKINTYTLPLCHRPRSLLPLAVHSRLGQVERTLIAHTDTQEERQSMKAAQRSRPTTDAHTYIIRPSRSNTETTTAGEYQLIVVKSQNQTLGY